MSFSYVRSIALRLFKVSFPAACDREAARLASGFRNHKNNMYQPKVQHSPLCRKIIDNRLLTKPSLLLLGRMRKSALRKDIRSLVKTPQTKTKLNEKPLHSLAPREGRYFWQSRCRCNTPIIFFLIIVLHAQMCLWTLLPC